MHMSEGGPCHSGCGAAQPAAFPAPPSSALQQPPALKHPPADCQLRVLLPSPVSQQSVNVVLSTGQADPVMGKRLH